MSYRTPPTHRQNLIPGGPFNTGMGMGAAGMSDRFYNPRYNIKHNNLYGDNWVDDYRDDYRYTDNDVDLYANEVYNNGMAGGFAPSSSMNPFSRRSRHIPGYEPGVDDYVPPLLRTPLHNPYEADDGISQIPPEVSRIERENLLANFYKFDVNGDGSISPRELQQTLRNADGTLFCASTIRMIYQVFDKDDSRSLEINEFYFLMKSLQYWNAKFKQFDLSQSGTISFTEYVKLLRYFGYNFSIKACAFIFKKFARYDEQSRLFGRTGNKLILKFDKFFESFMLLTYFFNQYVHEGASENIDYYLFRCFSAIGNDYNSGYGNYGLSPGMLGAGAISHQF